MTTSNKEMTLETATKMMNCKKGMKYPNTEHNIKMIASVSHNILKTLQAKRKLEMGF